MRYHRAMNVSADKFNLKRVKTSLAVVVVLSVLAGVIQILLLVLPSGGDAVPDAGDAAVSAASAEIHDGSASGGQDALSKAGDASIDDELRRRIGELRVLVVDGRMVTRSLAASIAAVPRDYTSAVIYIDQMETLPAGCEIVALAVVLQSMGLDADPMDIADNHLSMSGSPYEVYSGSPYSDGTGLPPCIVKTANSWLDEHGGDVRAYDISGTPFEGLLLLAEYGYPTLVWTTEDYVEPSGANPYGEEIGWYWPQHCVVLYGEGRDGVMVSDSVEGLITVEKDKFADLYEECGSMAVALLPG